MTAGAVTEATGESRLSRLGGPARATAGPGGRQRRCRRIAGGSAADARLLQGRAVLRRRVGRGPGSWRSLAVAARRADVRLPRPLLARAVRRAARGGAAPVPALLVAPIVVLAAFSLAGGIVVEPFADLAEDAAAVTTARRSMSTPAYHLDARVENVMAARGLGARRSCFSSSPRPPRLVSRALGRAGDRLGPRRVYERAASRPQPAVGCGAPRRGPRPSHEPRGRPGPDRRPRGPRVRRHARPPGCTWSARSTVADLPIVGAARLAWPPR